MTGFAIAVRFVHLGALTFLIGGFAFLLLVARPAFKHAGLDRSTDFERLDRLLLRLLGWSALVAVGSALLWLGVQVIVVSGRPLGEALALDTIRGVLLETQFGRVWQLRLALLALLGGFLLLRGRERDERDWLALRFEGLLLGGLVTATLAWAGHAAATEGPSRLLHLPADALHLLAAGVWLGGLPSLFLLLSWVRRSPDPSRVAVAREATRRFSALALVGVSGLVLTGLVNAWVLVGTFPALVGTPYGRLLLVKLLLLVPLLAIAAQNLLRLKPRLLAAPPAGSEVAGDDPLRRLRRNVLAEAGLGASILLLVGALGITPPALHTQPTWPFPFRLSWEANKDLPGVRTMVIAGGAGALLGAGVLAYGISRRRHRPWVVGGGLLLIGWFGAVALRPLVIDAYPTTYVRPTIPYHAISVAHGARLYQRHCAVCHGEAGYGDGPAALELPAMPADLTAKHTADHTAGDLFWWLTQGIKGSPMPGFRDHLSEEERWDVINFLRALAAAEEARLMSPLVEPEPWLVAPDFTFGIGVGRAETLRDQRGRAIVHLMLFTLPGSLSRLEQLDAVWTEIGLAGARIITVPMREADRIYRQLGTRAANLLVAVDGSQEIAETYALFRRTPEGLPPIPPGMESLIDAWRRAFAFGAQAPPIPPHMEFLIDRQGYIRARWIPGDGPGWDEIPRLLKEIERLDGEAPRAPAPDEHVH